MVVWGSTPGYERLKEPQHGSYPPLSSVIIGLKQQDKINKYTPS